MTESKRKYFPPLRPSDILPGMQRDSLVFRSLLTVARQRPGLDESRCRLVLELLSTAAAVNSSLHKHLESLGLSELRFGTLVVLFALDPSPVTPAEIAAQTGVTRSSITDVLDHLEAGHFVERQRDTDDRRVIYVHITASGRTTVDSALTEYLQVAGRTARLVPLPDLPALLVALTQINAGAAAASPAPIVPPLSV